MDSQLSGYLARITANRIRPTSPRNPGGCRWGLFWIPLVLAAASCSEGNEGDDPSDPSDPGDDEAFLAAYSATSPTIDGVIGSSEWSNANAYDILFVRQDGGDNQSGRVWMQHDGSYLYAASDTNWPAGWDVFFNFRIDGNHDHSISANVSAPFADVEVGYPSPSGWSGYSVYRAIDEDLGASGVTLPTGVERASDGSTDTTYEFKLNLSDFGVPSDGSFATWFWFGGDGVDDDYFYPSAEYLELSGPSYGNYVFGNPSKFPHVLLE